MSTQEIETEGPKRSLGAPQLFLGVLAVLLLLILVWFFFLRGDDDAADVVAPAPAPATTPAEEEEEESTAPRRSPVETFEVFAPKDPFDPLISAASSSAGDDATTSGSAASTGTSITGTTATTEGGESTGTTTTTTTGSGGGGEEVGGHRVRVIDVFAQGGSSRAQVQVDATVYTVDIGERFADNFELLSTSGRCATMLYGDDQFTLCEGEEILK